MSFELPGPDLAAPLKVSEIRFLLPSEGSQLLVDNPLLFQPDAEPVAAPNRGAAPAFHGPPGRFPHRIWAACDFEGQTPDYGWFGPAVQDSILTYPGNRTALGVGDRPYGDFSALMTGVNPVPGPRMGKQNKLYVRYRLEGTSEAVFQHFSLTSEDNQHVRVSGLRQNEWAETVVDFTGDAVRNDGSLQVFQEGERMDDFKVFAGPPNDGKHYDLLIDDVVFFADDPSAPPETEPFPRRIILLAAFDTGPQERYWPGSFELVEDGLPEGSHWRAARAVPQQPGAPNKWIRVQITPLRPVGERTRLRFRYYLRGARNMTVQIFDATVQDNRHVRLENLTQGAWTTASVDFTRDGIRNDGTTGDAFAAGNLVDDLFFFVAPEGEEELDLLIDEVVLYDAGED
jgi:hypothetical protein